MVYFVLFRYYFVRNAGFHEMLYLRNLDTMPIDANKTLSVPRMEPSYTSLTVAR
jgi:hypothetical protein